MSGHVQSGETTVISQQTLETILTQLSGVLKKNEELSEKVSLLQATVDKLTDQAVDIEILKAQLQGVTNGLEVHRANPRSSAGVAARANGTTAHSSGSAQGTVAEQTHRVKLESVPQGAHPTTSSSEGRQAEPTNHEVIDLVSDDEDVQMPPPASQKVESLHEDVIPSSFKRKARTDPLRCVGSPEQPQSKKPRVMGMEEDLPHEMPGPSRASPGLDDAHTVSRHERSVSPRLSTPPGVVPKVEGTDLDVKPSVAQPLLPAKIDPDSIRLKEEVAQQYLKSENDPFQIQSPLDIKISLEALTKAYHCRTQTFLWESKDKKYRWLFPGYQKNPLMPRVPRESGLLMSGRDEVLDGTWSIFIKVPNRSVARWNYGGEYKAKKVGALSCHDFKQQPQRVKMAWGNKIAAAKMIVPYAKMRARITLRKASVEITDENIEQCLKKIKSNTSAAISAIDVISAFESGEELIPITQVTCVGYLKEFAQDLARIAKESDETLAQSTSKAGIGATSRKIAKQTLPCDTSDLGENDGGPDSDADSGDEFLP